MFLTAIIDRKERGVDLLKKIGGHNFVAKPIEKIELLTVIKYILEGPIDSPDGRNPEIITVATLKATEIRETGSCDIPHARILAAK